MYLPGFYTYDLDHMKSIVLPPTLKALLPPQIHGLCSGAHYKKHERLFITGKSPEWMFYVVTGEVTLERTGLQGESVVLQRTRLGFVSEASLKTAKYHCDGFDLLPVCRTKVMEQSPLISENSGYETIQIYR